MASRPPLTPAQYDRYRRHLSLPELGLEGQLRLLGSSALLVGAGGLGCPLGQYLAAAGVGRIGIVDFDTVEASNLQRQVLYGTADVGGSKARLAAERLRALNPDVTVDVHAVRLDAGNALDILADYDVVVDGADNFPTRYLLNDACVLLGKPDVHGSVYRFEGQATVFDATRGPCYRCVFPEPPPPELAPSCAEGGVLGVLPGLVGLLQATETIKWLAGIGEPLVGRLVQYDGLDLSFKEFRIRKDPDCPVCGTSPTVTSLIDYEGFCGVPGREEEHVAVRERSAQEVAALRERGEGFLLLDVRNPDEWEKARIEGARLVPLPELASRLGELAEWKSRPVVVHCRKGPRGEKGAEVLQAAGFEDVSNMTGGIEAWSATVDPDVPTY